MVETLQGAEPTSSLARRLMAIAPALQAQEAAATLGQAAHSPRLLLDDTLAHLMQVAAKHLFPLEDEKPWHLRTKAKLQASLRGRCGHLDGFAGTFGVQPAATVPSRSPLLPKFSSAAAAAATKRRISPRLL